MIRASSAVAVIALIAGLPAAGADPGAAIEVDRDATPPGRVELGFDGGAPVDRWGVSVALGVLDSPIVLHGDGGDSAAVRHRETLALGGAIALGSSAVLDARIAFSHQVGDRLRAAGDPTSLATWVAGDLRFAGRVRITGTARTTLFAHAELTVPTGREHDFAGEARWTAAWNAIGRVVGPAGVTVAAIGGIRLRGSEVMIADRLAGDALFGAVGVLVPIPPVGSLWCERDQVKVTAELAGELGDSIASKVGPSPAEVRVGLVTRPLPGLTFGARVGAGLGDEIGAPRWRALVELAWTPAEVPRPPAPVPPVDPSAGDDPVDE